MIVDVMNSVSKFQFDTVFDLDEKGRAREKPKEPSFSEADVLAARTEAQQIGFEAGVAQSRREIEHAAATALQAIANSLPGMAERQHQAMLQVKEEGARLAHIIAGKLAPSLIRQAPEAEIVALLENCLSTMLEEPRLVVRLPEALMDDLPEALERVAGQAGFEGKLVIIGEPSLTGGDCRIEWANGGAERELKAVMAKVDAAIERYCAGLHDEVARLQAAADAADAAERRPAVETEQEPMAPPDLDIREAPGGIDEPLPTMSAGRGSKPTAPGIE